MKIHWCLQEMLNHLKTEELWESETMSVVLTKGPPLKCVFGAASKVRAYYYKGTREALESIS